MRKSYNAKFKREVSMEVFKSEKTIAEISSKYEVHRDQIQKWKKKAFEGMLESFSHGQEKSQKSNDKLVNTLYTEIGRLKVENDWFKKKL